MIVGMLYKVDVGQIGFVDERTKKYISIFKNERIQVISNKNKKITIKRLGTKEIFEIKSNGILKSCVKLTII